MFSGSSTEQRIICYSDADFAADIDERKSTTGYLIAFNGGLVCWKSCKQPIIAQSTTEAEFIAANLATRDVVWIKATLTELGRKYNEPIKMMMNNMSAITWITNDQTQPKNKHIAVKYMLIRDLYGSNIICPMFIGTKSQLADTLTKALAKEAFINIRKHILS